MTFGRSVAVFSIYSSSYLNLIALKLSAKYSQVLFGCSVLSSYIQFIFSIPGSLVILATTFRKKFKQSDK